MSLARSQLARRVWSEFESHFSSAAGVSVQAFDEHGRPLNPDLPLPPLCAFLGRQPLTRAECLNDCFRKAAEYRDTRQIGSGRCYAGLHFRLIPVRRRNAPSVTILVGRVLTELFGERQTAGFAEKYRVERQDFLEYFTLTKHLTTSELDGIMGFVRRMAATFAAADGRLEHCRSMLQTRRRALDFAGHVAALHDPGPDDLRDLLGRLLESLEVPGAAVCAGGEPGSPAEVAVAEGEVPPALLRMGRADWRALAGLAGSRDQITFPDRLSLLAAGIDCPCEPLVVRRLTAGEQPVGLLLLTGRTLNHRRRNQLQTYARLLASGLMHLQTRREAARREQEARVFHRMAERILGARDLGEILDRALEVAMHSLGARRGSILLAEPAAGVVTARALRGEHAALADSIRALHPESVSHRVFFSREPVLVSDAEREPGFEPRRQFPYAGRSYISVPLRENGHALGVLHLTEREGADAFTREDLQLLEKLGVQASHAIRRAKLEQEVRALRVHAEADPATGLHGRRYLEERISQELARASRFPQSLAVALIEADPCEAPAESSPGGREQVIANLARLICAHVRSLDVLARYGAERLGLLLPGTGREGALATAEKILDLVSRGAQPQPSGGVASPPVVRIGVACFSPEMALDVLELLSRSEGAVEAAKAAGGSRVHLWQVER